MQQLQSILQEFILKINSVKPYDEPSYKSYLEGALLIKLKEWVIYHSFTNLSKAQEEMLLAMRTSAKYDNIFRFIAALLNLVRADTVLIHLVDELINALDKLKQPVPTKSIATEYTPLLLL